MFVRSCSDRPGAAGEKSGDVMDLEADEVPDAVRQECAGDAAFQYVIRRQIDELKLNEKFRDFLVRQHVKVGIVGARTDGSTDLRLRGIHRIDELLELVGVRGVGSRDVRCVAVRGGAGVDEEGTTLFPAISPQVLEVKDHAVLSARADVSVGQLVPGV